MKELSLERMEEVHGGWSDADTVATICLVGPFALFWVPVAAFALRAACVVTAMAGLAYAAGAY